MSVAGVLNEPCTVWFAVGGTRVGLGFLCVLQHCAFGFVKIWWCQWKCWMSRAQCDLLLVVWVLAMAWDSVFCVPAVVAWVLGRWRELRPPPSMHLLVYTRLSMYRIICWADFGVHGIQSHNKDRCGEFPLGRLEREEGFPGWWMNMPFDIMTRWVLVTSTFTTCTSEETTGMNGLTSNAMPVDKEQLWEHFILLIVQKSLTTLEKKSTPSKTMG